MSQFPLNRLISKLYQLVALFIVCSLAFALPAAAQAEDEKIKEIEAEVSEIRGLEIKTPITVTYKTREELQKKVDADFFEDYPIEDSERDQRTMTAFGIIESGTDILQLYSELYGGQIAGYYDPTTAQLVVVLDGEAGEDITASEEFTLAHEINHAIQDQHFDIDAGAFDTSEATDDVSLAGNGLVEGDSSLLQGLYLQANPSFARDLSREYSDLEDDGSLDDFPPVIVALLYFPYNDGYEFVDWLHEEGGYELVDEAFASPPTTTEQILHPEKYLDGEVGEDVTVIDLAPVLGGEWVDTDENAFGEYIMSQLLMSENVDDDDAEDAAEGWNGDLYKVAGSGDSSAIVWQSSWDSDDDAEEFAETVAERESDRLGENADEDDGTYTIGGDTGVVKIHVEDDAVTYVFAPDEAAAQSIMDAQLSAE